MAQQIDPSFYANLPAEAPPPGVIQNLNHPQSRAFEARVAMSVCIGITTILVVLRMYVKLAITHMLGWDDCKTIGSMSMCGLLTAIGTCLLGFVSRSSLLHSEVL